MALDIRTRSRARALQMLYAREICGAPGVPRVASGLCRIVGGVPAGLEEGERLAEAVVHDLVALDREASAAAENWRLERLGVVDRNILRLAIHELRVGQEPPKAVINEAVRLAHWFGGLKSPGFVNGVLDRVARDLGRL